MPRNPYNRSHVEPATPEKLDALVPGTSYRARDLCRVRTSRKPIGPGTILGYKGAWDNKYLLVSITLVEQNISHPHYSAPDGYDRYMVVTRFLGKFFADGRVLVTKRRPESLTKEDEMFVPHGEQLKRELPLGRHRYVPVEPLVGMPLEPKNPLLYMDEVEQMAWRLFGYSKADYPGEPKYAGQQVRTPDEQAYYEAIKDRTYRKSDFPQLMAIAASRLKAEKVAKQAYLDAKSLLPFKSMDDVLSPPGAGRPSPTSLPPEAALEMFRLKTTNHSEE